MPDPVVITIDADEFKELIGRNSRLSAAIKRDLRKGIRDAGKLGMDRAKAEVRKSPGTQAIKPNHSTGLRAALAAGIKLRVLQTGVEIKSTGGAKGGRMARSWDKPGGFRHPVFGNRGLWAAQKGRPYFKSEIYKVRPQMLEKIKAEIHRAVQSNGG